MSFNRLDEKVGRVDRHLQCPFLLRVFVNKGKHHYMMDYEKNILPQKEVQIYTWPDTTLRELADLIIDVNHDAQARGTKFRFAFVYPEVRKYGYRLREAGVVVNGHPGSDDNITLGKANYQVGDYVDVALDLRNDRSESPPSSRGGHNGGSSNRDRDRRRH